MNVRKYEEENSDADINILLSKCTNGVARVNVPIWRTNHYQQYFHIMCIAGGISNLGQVYLENKLAIEYLLNQPF